MSLLDEYRKVTGAAVITHMQQLAAPLQGMKVVHVNSTRSGGGVAEILTMLVPLTRELGIDAEWHVITGNSDFFRCTKAMHNALQGYRMVISDDLLDNFQKTNATNAEALRDTLEQADIVFIHDPQPAPLLRFCPNRRGKWIWRCHIDVSRPYRSVWKYLQEFVAGYDASVFSLAGFAQQLPHPQYLVPPSIDPLSDKNRDIPEQEINAACAAYGVDRDRPLLVQVSRFDRFKDPVGVIQAYRQAKHFAPGIQLVLAGGGATDDPEGDVVLAEVWQAAGDDPDIHVLNLPPDSHRTVNALQRAATIVLQKSVREGFGLTVTEALWKGRPVIGGDVGGIRLQLVNHHTGFLVNTPDGAAVRIRYLLRQPEKMREMGRKGRELVLENFLITRHLREYLTLSVALLHGKQDRIELS